MGNNGFKQLPYSDELNIGYLSRLFDVTTNCYKFFWFQAILRKLREDRVRFTYDELINEMIADAWYMVVEYHLHLASSTDNLEEAVKYLSDVTHFPASEKRENILHYLENNDDKELLNYKKILTLNVPYRLQSPFLDEISVEKREWYRPEAVIYKINQQKRLLYYFEGFQQLSTTICLNDDWVPYLIRNREILMGWLQLNLIHYLQRRNPSVPGIADKLNAPLSRDIGRVRNYWKVIIEHRPEITDIYGHFNLAEESISVDHFVPWQYVAHDELWNLHPTTKSINSSKSNGLPDWDLYFQPLYELEYISYRMSRNDSEVGKAFANVAKYHLNNPDITGSLYCDGLTESQFGERLRNVIYPVYLSAKNNGFLTWKYEGESCRR